MHNVRDRALSGTDSVGIELNTKMVTVHFTSQATFRHCTCNIDFCVFAHTRQNELPTHPPTPEELKVKLYILLCNLYL